MKSFRFFSIALLLCLLNPYFAFNQTDEKKAKKRTVQVERRCSNPEKNELKILQLYGDDGAGVLQEVDRAVLEIEFNQMVDEIDFLYHTPAQFQKHPHKYFGYHQQKTTPKKGKQ